MEIWHLRHPEHGLIEVVTGFDNELPDIDPQWPGELAARFRDSPDAITPVPADGTPLERARALRNKPPTRLLVRVNGEVQHRYSDIDSGRIPLFGPAGAQPKVEPMMHVGIDRAKPHLNLTISSFKELLQVEYREGTRVVEFDPPAGTRGARRRDMMQSSSFRRTAIPIAEGVGKGGWALAVIVLGPLVGRLMAWLGQFLPDWELPDITLPHVDLPLVALPHVELPLPDIPFPDITLPEWVGWLAEYAKIWMPVVIGIVLGIVALRNHRKSEAEKQRWSDERSGDGPQLSDAAD